MWWRRACPPCPFSKRVWWGLEMNNQAKAFGGRQKIEYQLGLGKSVTNEVANEIFGSCAVSALRRAASQVGFWANLAQFQTLGINLNIHAILRISKKKSKKKFFFMCFIIRLAKCKVEKKRERKIIIWRIGHCDNFGLSERIEGRLAHWRNNWNFYFSFFLRVSAHIRLSHKKKKVHLKRGCSARTIAKSISNPAHDLYQRWTGHKNQGAASRAQSWEKVLAVSRSA